jgi:hypothetical protein
VRGSLSAGTIFPSPEGPVGPGDLVAMSARGALASDVVHMLGLRDGVRPVRRRLRLGDGAMG